MPVETTNKLAAEALFVNNDIVDRAIEALVDELQRARGSIISARPATADRRESYADYLQRVGTSKGKPPYYPYVGSGLGNGPLVELLDGSVKWDLISGIGVHAFGHSDPELIEVALRAAMSDTVMQGNLQFNADSIEFGELLVHEASRNTRLQHVFLINSGALANETALKVCMQKKDGKASRVLAFRGCFMGRTTTMCQIGDSAAGRAGIPLNVMIDYLPFYDPVAGRASIDQAERQLKEFIRRYPGQHACFVFELVQGEGGFNTAPSEFFIPLMELCREHEIPVWIDEIQTFGRTEEMFACDMLGLGEYVDVVTIGKMTQVCACLFTDDLNPKPGLLSATFVGSTIGLQVGRRIVERLRAGGHYGRDGRNALLQQAFRDRISRFIDSNRQWFPPVLNERDEPMADYQLFDGVGGMMRFTPFGGVQKKVIDACHALFDEGIICFYCGHQPFHIRFLPPVGVMQPEHFDEVFEILERGLARVASG